jgi:hypothetical protein
LACLQDLTPGAIDVAFEQHKLSLQDFLNTIEQFSFPPRILDFTTLVPCQVVDAATFATRDEVFDYSHTIYSEYLRSAKPRSIRLPVPLIYELKSFYQSVLPELIDNVRLHKGRQNPNICAFYVRLRRRDERLYGVRRYAEPSWQQLTELKRRTLALWQDDVVEAVFIDTGLSIQETWLAAWQRTHGAENDTTPRLPSGKPVDSHNADSIILKSVFLENASSFSGEERLAHNLPRLTGLHSLRKTIHGSLWGLSVRSGKNGVVILSDDSDADNPPTVDLAGRYPKTPGVCFFFRFTAGTGRPLSNWCDALPTEGLENATNWWTTSYPPRFARAHVIDQFELPPAAQPDDVVICRANHFIGKHRLYNLLHAAERMDLHIIFAEVATPVALRLGLLINELAEDVIPLESLYPIITSSFHLLISGAQNKIFAHSFAEQSDGVSAWWTEPSSPIRSVRETFLRCRQFDSEDFWSNALCSKSAFLREPVRWSHEWTLFGGYLNFHVALRDRRLRKLLRRRIVTILQGLRVREVVASSDSLRHLAAEVRRNCILNAEDSAPEAILASVTVTGDSLRTTKWQGQLIALPVFKYPEKYIRSPNGDAFSSRRPTAYILDWHESPQIAADINAAAQANGTTFARIGSTDEIGTKPSEQIGVFSQRGPREAYKDWQSLQLLNIGHYSYGSNHYFVTIDLVGFVNSQSPEASEMLISIATKIASLAPAAIFYLPHEASESLVDQLIKLSDIYGINFPADLAIPLVSIHNLRMHLPPPGERPIVFLDDALVSGKTIREVRAELSAHAGQLYSFVILDRGDPAVEVPRQEHYSWWSLGIPPVGPRSACSICRGLSRLQFVAQTTQSPTLRDLLNHWHEHWSHTDSLSRYSNPLEVTILPGVLRKRLGSIDKNVSLKSSEGLCTWALDMMGRLRHFFYPFDKSREDLRPALAEILAGMIFMYWDSMGPAHRDLTLQAISDCMYWEDRASARSLIAVAIASLGQAEIKLFFDFLSLRLRASGMPNFDTAVLTYLVTRLAHPSEGEASKQLFTLVKQTADPRSAVPKERRESTVSILACFADIDNPQLAPRAAMESLGLPQRGHKHPYLLAILRRLALESMSTESFIHDLFEASTFLDPVQSVLRDRRRLFADRGIVDHLEQAFDEFNTSVRRRLEVADDPEGVEACRRICKRLHRFLAADVYGGSNVIEVLAEHFVHYIPFRLRKILNSMASESTAKRSEGRILPVEFDIKAEMCVEEKRLLGEANRLPEERRVELTHSLQRFDVILADAAELDSVLRDLILDVKHPKSLKLMMEGRSYITVTFASAPETIKEVGQSLLWLEFKNRATVEQANRAIRGRSWNLIELKVARMGGIAQSDFDPESKMLSRKIWLPAIGRRYNASMESENGSEGFDL